MDQTFTIQWKGKPSNHDTHLVKLLWFDGARIRYICDGANKVLSDPRKDVLAIYSVARYRQTENALNLSRASV